MAKEKVESKKDNLSEGAKQLIEDLAELEHEQWISWSKEIASTETISWRRLNKWKKLWVPYQFLTEKEKEQDRKWARKVLKCQWDSANKEMRRRENAQRKS